jgi:hypothetical protein
MNIDFTNKEIQLLFELINNVSWSGKQIEMAYDLKNKIKNAFEKEEEKNINLT